MYDELNEEDRVRLAIECVAADVPIPKPIEKFLTDVGLLEHITRPRNAQGNQSTAD